MKKYNLINYDVWGNRSEGYQVNDAYRTSIEIELPEEYTDLELRRALYNSRFCTRGILTAKIEINHDYPSTIEINLTGTRYQGKPFCELRLIES